MINFAKNIEGMEKEKIDKKEHILDIAEDVFSEFGYEGTSTRFLANKAGVNMAMLNYYFGSKDGVLKAVMDRRITNLRQYLQEIKDKPISSTEKLMRAFEMYLNRITENKNFHRVIHREISLNQRSELVEFISENIYKNLNVLREIILEGIADHSFRQVDVEMTVASILGLMYYLLNSPRVSGRLLNIDFQDPDQFETTLKPRIREYFKDYLKAYLLTHETKA